VVVHSQAERLAVGACCCAAPRTGLTGTGRFRGPVLDHLQGRRFLVSRDRLKGHFEVHGHSVGLRLYSEQRRRRAPPEKKRRSRTSPSVATASRCSSSGTTKRVCGPTRGRCRSSTSPACPIRSCPREPRMLYSRTTSSTSRRRRGSGRTAGITWKVLRRP
jgi:hypothetical protein